MEGVDLARVRRAGKLLGEAWRAARSLETFEPTLRARSRAEAIAIQDAMAQTIGEPVTGWKLGATSPIMRERAGHDGAIIGRVFESVTFQSPASLAIARFPHARAECEFAFRVTAPIAARTGGWTEAELRERVELHAALEIIGNRYPRGANAFKPGTNDEIADNGAGIGFVFGPPIEDWRALDLSNLDIDIRVDDGEPAENFLGEGRCPPLNALAQATEMLGARGIDIQIGQYVSTGAATDPQPVAAGCVVVADFAGKARIEARFRAP